MDLRSFLAQIRDHYVEAFSSAVADRVSDPEQWLVEHAFANPDASDEEDEDEGLILPVRFDLIPLQDGEPGEILVIRTESMPDFEDFGFDHGGMGVAISPFTWDQCQMAVQGLSPESDWDPLINWFEKWFDVPGKKEPGPDRTLGVIHALYPPATDEDGQIILLDLDLGTAPPEALVELLDTLKSMGAEAVALTRTDEEEEGEPAEDEDE